MDPSVNRPQLPSHQELSMIKEYLLLPLVLSVFERDARYVRESPIKTPDPYIKVIHRAMDQASGEWTRLRAEFRRRGIQVTWQKLEPEGLYASYLCRGYSGSMRLLIRLVKSEIEIRHRKYLGEDMTCYRDLNQDVIDRL